MACYRFLKNYILVADFGVDADMYSSSILVQLPFGSSLFGMYFMCTYLVLCKLVFFIVCQILVTMYS